MKDTARRDPQALALAATLSARLTLITPDSARADAPLVSETADVIGAGDCQFQAALAHAKLRGLPATNGWDLLGSCGIGGHSQVALGYSRERAEGLTAQALRVLGKSTLVAPEAGRTGWGLRYGAAFDSAPGEGRHQEGLEVLAAMTRELAPGLLLHASLGHAHSRNAGTGSTTWSLGVERSAGSTTIAADAFSDDRSRPWVAAGIGRQLSDALSVNASVALGFEQPRLTQLTLGAKLAFQPAVGLRRTGVAATAR